MPIPPLEDEQKLGPPIDIIEIVLFGVGRFRFWVIPFGVIGLAVGIAMALIKPNQFTSTANLWVQWEKRETLSVENVITGTRQPLSNGRRGGLGMQEEFLLIRTPEFYERIAREVGPDRLVDPIDPTRYDTDATKKFTRWQHQLQDWYFNRGRKFDPEKAKGFDFETNRGISIASNIVKRGLRMQQISGNVFKIAYRARSPEIAQDVVAAASKVAIETHTRVFANRFKGEFVTAQLAVARNDTSTSIEDYYEHQTQCGFYDLPSQKSALLSDRNRVSIEIDRGEIKLDGLSRRKEHALEELATLPKMIMQQQAAKLGKNRIYSALEQKITTLENRQAALTLDYKPDSEFYISTYTSYQEQIDATEETLSITPREIEISEAAEVEIENPEYIRVSREISKFDLDQTTILDAEVKYRKHLQEVAEQLEDLLACEPVHSSMRDDVSKSKRRAQNFENAIDKRDALSLLDQDEDMSNMWVMIPASYNPVKSGPKRGESILQGLGAGVGAGMLFGILRQLMDSRIRYPMTVQKSLGIPVLGVIPEQKRWKRLGKKILKQNGSA